MQAMRELNYAPDGLTRAMDTRRKSTIGAVVSDVANLFCRKVVEALRSDEVAAGSREPAERIKLGAAGHRDGRTRSKDKVEAATRRFEKGEIRWPR